MHSIINPLGGTIVPIMGMIRRSTLLQRIKWRGLPQDQYIREVTQKNQIYLHHTAGGPDPFSVVDWWDSTDERVATHFIIGGKQRNNNSIWEDGDLVQCYNTKYWAYHLGLKSQHLAVTPLHKSSKELNSRAITIEICNWGPVSFNDTSHQFETIQHNYPVSPTEVVEYGNKYRGYRYYQRYTDAQLETLTELLRYLCDHWDIPKQYMGDSIFDIDVRALQGNSGIFTHTSVRPDKSDCHPQKELIQVLQSL